MRAEESCELELKSSLPLLLESGAVAASSLIGLVVFSSKKRNNPEQNSPSFVP
jgi:hypothetical protein